MRALQSPDRRSTGRASEPTSPAGAPEAGARQVALVLRIGGALGAALVLAGLTLAVAQGGASWLHGPGGDPLGADAAMRLTDLSGGLRHGRAGAVILLGTIVLAATPAAGVIAAGLAWLRARRGWLVGAAVVVLLLLVLAGALGAAE
ncbi:MULTISPECIES: DUF1634 domain-containing protein [Frankia]|uniref:Hypothetical integral membrane protein n=1 Tax=Frankia alni (strain DSM 45986 / CECT 9034 / ACN14a) TaxID=326424 RepID=Q0RHY6_FRAAA|nr:MULTISPECIES: DUF1634 domain-containing protein [Frankia]CAJ62887.1 hypothetical integral membrane protein [Frankia alni ACN14a]